MHSSFSEMLCAFSLFFLLLREWAETSDHKHKINSQCLNSPIRQALTRADQCSDRGMWMSHVFNIIYTALLFLSPPLRQLSILLDHNQSVICQLLSILFLLHVSFWSWLCAASDGEKGKRSILENSHLIWGPCSFSFWFSLERFLCKNLR